MGLLSQMLEEKRIDGDWRVESAGTWGLEGDPAAAGSQAVMNNIGIDISEHRARRVDYELLQVYDLILTMENGHKEALCMEFPDFSDRIYMLSEMADQKQDIGDPYGGAYSGYETSCGRYPALPHGWIRNHPPACISIQLKVFTGQHCYNRCRKFFSNCGGN